MRDEIVAGLKMALTKGENLQEAMQSFYNSGYDKVEIEQAAREVQGLQISVSKPTDTIPSNQNSNLQSPQPQMQKNNQVVSGYNQPEKDSSALIWVSVTLFLVLFIGVALTAVYLYRENIVQFLSNIFG